ncbi:MAG: LamG-like jellyroll fold domain-containing protein [Candidatus Falkowbacteria bacterium]
MSERKAFTLIELLVVIVIIGILSTLAIVALNSFKAKARDARRVADIKQLQSALELYFTNNNVYPSYVTVNQSLVDANGVVYMKKVPSSPAPRKDGGCPDYDYQYVSSPNNNNYQIFGCLGSAVGSLPAGQFVAQPQNFASLASNYQSGGSLALYYPMSGDNSGYGPAPLVSYGSVPTSTTDAPPRTSAAFQINSTAATFKLPQTSGIWTNSNGLTIALWYKPNEGQGGTGDVILGGRNPNSTAEIVLQCNNSSNHGNLYFKAEDASGHTLVVDTAVPYTFHFDPGPNNPWTHIVVTVAPNYASCATTLSKIYINGQPNTGSANCSTNGTLNVADMSGNIDLEGASLGFTKCGVACWAGGSAGKYADLRIYNKMMNAAEVLALYNGQ